MIDEVSISFWDKTWLVSIGICAYTVSIALIACSHRWHRPCAAEDDGEGGQVLAQPQPQPEPQPQAQSEPQAQAQPAPKFPRQAPNAVRRAREAAPNVAVAAAKK
ncbi:hypothetical protein PLESTB_001568800 [Pleodorina starrii]|uniref:Uncharacterized protein n=1 Tax=Pleodorina starrii TaxID=330485 RepID=A0A9W6F8B0_9CHLO|nr:hypothetical protein PLESTM_001484800 [Pleodorina starrii]GLC60059.1 hypothetical protein PLESTB_001568800 [Pleodorina starrii]GLC72714.1 hypothetical protein PLESTF_001285300 [Pleodorina starrii]